MASWSIAPDRYSRDFVVIPDRASAALASRYPLKLARRLTPLGGKLSHGLQRTVGTQGNLRHWFSGDGTDYQAAVPVMAMRRNARMAFAFGLLLTMIRLGPRAARNERRTSSENLGASIMERLRDRSRPGFGYHLKVHSFRTLTMILAWILIVTAFYQKPELLTGAQRLVQRGIEAVGDALPRPLGPRLEFVFREIGGLVWLQITMVVVALRLALSTVATTWRFIVRRDRDHWESRLALPDDRESA